MRKIEANGQQTLLDIALQHCGAAEAVFAIAELNSVSPDTVPCHGDIVNLPDVVNKKVVNYYSANKIVPATANLPVFGISLRCSGGGTVGISHNAATAGTVVTLTTTPDDDYMLSEITIAGASDLIVPTDNGNGTFSFVMPASDVKIEVNFIQVSHSIALTIDGIGAVVASHDTATAGTVVTLTATPGEGYELATLEAMAESGNLVLSREQSNYTFTMPASSVTINAVFAQTEPTAPDWGLVDTAPGDWSGEYILASVDDNMMATGNLSSYQIACGAVRLRDNRFIPASEAANAKKFTIGNRYFVQTGAYSGRYAYTITYQNANNETKYLTYSASGLSSGTSISNNTRWYIELDPNRGKVSLINIGTTTTRLYFYTDHIQQLTAWNHDSISQNYHKLSLFKEEAEAQAAE